MWKGIIGVVVGVLICSPAFAGGPGADEASAKPTKELMDSSGRVWPDGVPSKLQGKAPHPKLNPGATGWTKGHKTGWKK